MQYGLVHIKSSAVISSLECCASILRGVSHCNRCAVVSSAIQFFQPTNKIVLVS